MQEVSNNRTLTTRVLLVVENEKSLLDSLRVAFANLGFEVWTVASCDQARELLRCGARPDFLLTDGIIPGDIQGPYFFRYSLQLLPSVPSILMLGHLIIGDVAPDPA